MTLKLLSARLSCIPWVRRLYKTVKPLPLVGGWGQRLVPFVLTGGVRVWSQVQSGPGKGLWLNLDPWYEQDFLEGTHELAIQVLIGKCVTAGATIYDVGAHVGFISMIAARTVGTVGRVYAFEADPENAARIREHAERNGLSQVEVVPFAVWSECTRVVFEEPSPESGRCQGKVIPARGNNHTGRQIEVQAITLDSFAAGHPQPALIKVDVEGAEAQVLEGAGQVFDHSRPRLILEVHHQQAKTQVESFLATKHYAPEWLTRNAGFPRHLLALPEIDG